MFLYDVCYRRLTHPVKDLLIKTFEVHKIVLLHVCNVCVGFYLAAIIKCLCFVIAAEDDKVKEVAIKNKPDHNEA